MGRCSSSCCSPRSGSPRWPKRPGRNSISLGVFGLFRESERKIIELHIVHLSSLAIDILRSLPQIGTKGFLFTRSGDRPVTGFGGGAANLIAEMTKLAGSEVEHFTLHDLRRSAVTHMAGLGIAHHVVDKLLNHVSGKISGIAAVYNRHQYIAERKAALEAWSSYVEKLVGADISNIVSILK